jgi:hypothetical protein
MTGGGFELFLFTCFITTCQCGEIGTVNESFLFVFIRLLSCFLQCYWEFATMNE